jgi:hypothetical protein
MIDYHTRPENQTAKWDRLCMTIKAFDIKSKSQLNERGLVEVVSDHSKTLGHYAREEPMHRWHLLWGPGYTTTRISENWDEHFLVASVAAAYAYTQPSEPGKSLSKEAEIRHNVEDAIEAYAFCGKREFAPTALKSISDMCAEYRSSFRRFLSWPPF